MQSYTPLWHLLLNHLVNQELLQETVLLPICRTLWKRLLPCLPLQAQVLYGHPVEPSLDLWLFWIASVRLNQRFYSQLTVISIKVRPLISCPMSRESSADYPR